MFSHVHIIDDDTTTVFLLRMLMQRIGFSETITSSENGSVALTFLAEQTHSGQIPQLIFLDINMPVMNGWEFLEHCQSLHNGSLTIPPIVVLSSTVDPADERMARKSPHVVAFLNKPLTREHLSDLLASFGKNHQHNS
jgi:CheY-like chemotaxis protein